MNLSFFLFSFFIPLLLYAQMFEKYKSNKNFQIGVSIGASKSPSSAFSEIEGYTIVGRRYYGIFYSREITKPKYTFYDIKYGYVFKFDYFDKTYFIPSIGGGIILIKNSGLPGFTPDFIPSFSTITQINEYTSFTIYINSHYFVPKLSMLGIGFCLHY